MIKPFSIKVEKPWGYEILYTQTDFPFVGKVSFTKAGNRWSFQYHDIKEEVICLLSGEAEIWLEDEGEIKKFKMELRKGYHVSPNQKHRFCAISDCTSVEISTPEVGITVRLEDDYKRNDETEEDRKIIQNSK